MIHPLSLCRFIWECCMIFVYLAAFFLTPMQFFFHVDEHIFCMNPALLLIRRCIDYVCLLDFLGHFLTGFVQSTIESDVVTIFYLNLIKTTFF